MNDCAQQAACIGGSKHNFKPLSDSYAKYKAEYSTKDSNSNYNYSKREELTPGVLYSTLFCTGCGTVVEVVAQNSTEKEMHGNVNKKESRKDTPAETGDIIAPKGDSGNGQAADASLA